jgi:hypothetical protein
VLALTGGVGTAHASAKARPRAVGVDWGSGHFSAAHELAAWLGSRGVRYADWAQRHPRGRYLLTHAPPKAHPPPVRVAAPPPPRHTARGPRPALRGIYGVAAVLLLLALMPSTVLSRLVPERHRARLVPARTTLAAAGLSLVLGVIVASLL